MESTENYDVPPHTRTQEELVEYIQMASIYTPMRDAEDTVESLIKGIQNCLDFGGKTVEHLF